MNAENYTPMAFRFSSASQDMQTVLYNNEPWVVAKDVCDILELGNVTKALYALEDDEKLILPIVRAGQTRNTNLVNESGLYALIFKSRKPEAKQFRKWITSEVLPALRKQGFYSTYRPTDDYVDMRDVPPSYTDVNDYKVCTMHIEEEPWYAVNDIHRAIHANTSANQTVKKLNAKRQLAIKIFTYGSTNPAWFTCLTGLQLIISGSRVVKDTPKGVVLCIHYFEAARKWAVFN